MTATVFGKPLRDPSWSALCVRQRLVRELDAWISCHPPAMRSLVIFWHSARKYALSTLARADCSGHLSLCLNVQSYRDAQDLYPLFLFTSSLVFARLIEDSPREVGFNMVPIPTDFAAFDEDKETNSLEPPPIFGSIAGCYSLTSTLLKTSNGPAAIATGTVSLPASWIDWFIREGHDLYRSERFFTATFMPPHFIEATFLHYGLNIHNSTGLIPTFYRDIPWTIPDDCPFFEIQLPYLQGLNSVIIYSLSIMYYKEIDDQSRKLRRLIDDALLLIISGNFQGSQYDSWVSRREQWESALNETMLIFNKTFGTGIGSGKLTIYALHEAPKPGAWIPDTDQFASEVEHFTTQPESRILRKGPFLVGKIIY